jgi:hypothetical protein
MSEDLAVQQYYEVEEEARVITTTDKLKFFMVSSVGFFSDGWLNGGWTYSKSPRSTLCYNRLVWWHFSLTLSQWSP